ncbi:hypothetical protein AB1L42_18350 [Thalassoglobus sp. JC818]|uniref:hypothetical protein n=1 Tax=Thalassoglobus sp. JC818 TaxID=3232136 RepID=UPI00345AC39D
MRLHWREIQKKIRHWAAPVAATLMSGPALLAQAPVQFQPMAPTPNPGVVQASEQQHLDPYYSQNYTYSVPTNGAPYGPIYPQDIATSRYAAFDVANMVGTHFGTVESVAFSSVNIATDETVDGIFGVPAANRVTNIAENNSPIPRDRFYMSYSHFANPISSHIRVDDPNDMDDDLQPIPATGTNAQLNHDQFMLGIEKAFFGDSMSLELRVPIIVQVDQSVPGVIDPTSTAFSMGRDDPNGNISLNFKRVIGEWHGEHASALLTGGAGITFAASDRTHVTVGDAEFYVDNSAYHFNPFLAFVVSGKGRWFMQAFFEADFSTDDITVHVPGEGRVGYVDVPDYYNIDLGVGYWMTRHTERRFLRGVAPILEFHYGRQRQDSQGFAFIADGDETLTNAVFGSLYNRQDVYNFTSGIHTELTRWMNTRVAGVFPFRGNDHRQFDAALMVQVDIVR